MFCYVDVLLVHGTISQSIFITLCRVERIYDDIRQSIAKKDVQVDFRLNKLPLVITRVTALTGILVYFQQLCFLGFYNLMHFSFHLFLNSVVLQYDSIYKKVQGLKCN